jgi:predicted O-linked N-acetylglucosamine transferase (SPINDLY family)
MGADYIDYLIADEFVVPPGREAAYAEKVVRLPDTFQANDARRSDADRTPSRTEAGLPERAMVFCSFNKSAKITPVLFDAWMEILRGTEAAVLWLWKDSARVEDNLRREAQARGVAPERLVFAPTLPYPEHLARLRLADLSLDTLPFNGGATASDALWSGVPVLTCPGDAFAARMAGSLLRAIGLPELIAATLGEYKALAIRLGTDADRLAGLKRKLAANRGTHPLFDADRFRRHLEAAYEIMHARSQNGEAPAHFRVDPSASSARSTTR